MTIAAAFAPVAPAFDAAGDVADREFLRQLTERAFFSLAEQHCQEMLSEAATPYQRAKWQLRLCQTYEKHAWSTEAASRAGLLNRSVEELTQFLNTSAAFPELDMQARLQLVSALTQSVRMALPIAEAGHLFGRKVTTASTWNQTSVKAHIGTIDRGILLIQELQTHLERIRREIAPDAARTLRDRARLAVGELLVLKCRLLSGGTTDSETYRQAEAAVTQSQRTTKGQLRHRASWLMAELSLYADDDETFQLRIRTMFGSETSADAFMPQFLSIRSLLFAQDATSASTLAKETTPQTWLQQQQLQWLKLESLLGLRELAEELKDKELTADVTTRFRNLQAAIRQSGVGVFRDAAEQTFRRFDLVDEVGVNVADLIEKIERNRAAGESAAALTMIRTTLQQLPISGFARSRGFLHLRAGEILIEQKQWLNARTSLEAAVTELRSAKLADEEAAADLLRIFAIAQMLGDSGESTLVSEEQYVAVLEDHLANYSTGNTVSTARDWLRKVVTNRDPMRAARLLMDQFAAETKPGRRIELLTTVSELLRQSHTTGDSERFTERREAFIDAVREMRENPGEYPPADIVLLELAELSCLLQSEQKGAVDWTDVKTKLVRIAGQMAALEDKPSESLQHQLLVMRFIATARTRSHASALTALRAAVAGLPADHALDAIFFLDAQNSGAKNQAGVGMVASVVSELLQQRLSDTRSPRPYSETTMLLSIALRAAGVTGDFAVVDQLLTLALQQDLSDGQLTQISEMLTAASDTVNSVSHTPAGKKNDSQTKFWHKVLSSQVQGSQPWLEASLQLAVIAAKSGEVAKARKQLGIVETLYPNWGADERLERANKLLRRLNED